jgi:replicative DNA helicase
MAETFDLASGARRGGAADRTPPHDVIAEQSVLGGMLLSKDAIADVVEVLRAHDFYRPAHELVFDAALDLYGRGEPADAITVAAELTKRGEIARIGGAPYLHTLMQSVPTAANAGYYAKIVRERAILRRLVEAGTKIVQLGYASDGADADEIVDRASAEIYGVTDRRLSEDYLPLSDIMEGALDEIEAIGSRGGAMVGVPTGFIELDQLTNGLHPGQMIVLAARPALGKSTMGLDLARSASIRHGLASCIFSLEMSRNEIVMRLLSAEARVPLHHMRSGSMTDDDWNRLARKMGEVSSAPLFIDDSPNMTMMEIRSKCRRLKQRHELRLVVIDYLQLMTSGKRVESRQQEVSEFSRQLKLLAKELEVPVVAISQLNRGAEQRTDKRPQMADLRESGCLSAGTRVLRADTGAEVTLGDLIATGERDVPVWSLDSSLRYVPATMTHAFSSGRKQVHRLRLASGKVVDATANHPFLTYNGWRPLGDLVLGDRVAVARHVGAPTEPAGEWPDADVIMLAHLIGDDPVGAGRVESIPPGLFALPKSQIALFLRRLWSTGGSSTVAKHGHGDRISYSSTSRELINDVSRLLLRFGISCRVESDDQREGHRAAFSLHISERADQKRFLQEIGRSGRPAPHEARLREPITTPMSTAEIDKVPGGVWSKVREALVAPRVSHRELAQSTAMAPGGSTTRGLRPCGDRLAWVAAVLGDADLEMLATNDVLWDRIVGVEALGEQEVYDATVLGNHNFLANGITVHNSIEQDADMVILLHREDAYERESPRQGEADFIVAKHRNGPTATITVAFQGHYSRFVDMAQI